jgi:hypothetical protein
VQGQNGRFSHREKLGGAALRATRAQKYRVPEALVAYLVEGSLPTIVAEIADGLRAMALNPLPEVKFSEDPDEQGHLEDLALELIAIEGADKAQEFVARVVAAGETIPDPGVQAIIDQIVIDYQDTAFTKEVPSERPIRGPFGEATIELKPGVSPVKQRPFHLVGERREALAKLVEEFERDGKLEPGKSAWCSPAFPVPKKTPGQYRMVVDYRAVNDATITDAHPLPRIEDILIRQGGNKMWSVLDMKDGYHQIPLKPEHRHITCMATPRGVMQWKVLVMGLKNGGAIFQRVMEGILGDIDGVDVYIDDVIIGSTGDTRDQIIANHEALVRRVLDRLAESKMIVEPRKCHWFAEEVEFCGHLLREGRREPAPGKLLSLQKWELPRTVTQLRGFLGLANYYSAYVPSYADFAGPLMSKLQLNREDGKKGSTKALVWKDSEIESFHQLKAKLAEHLELFQCEPDKPFVMHTDASDKAIGAVLEQYRVVNGETRLVPVAFFSRKLAKSQLNWTPREKETYAVVSALRKYAGWIGLQPILILTDHKSLEDWVHEKMDTPSGPAGRRARWHETLSKFDLTVQYMPGRDNIVADALSRFAYPAAKAFQDTSFHGDEEARKAMKKIIAEELQEGRQVGVIGAKCDGGNEGRLMTIAGPCSRNFIIPEQVRVTTRARAYTGEDDIEDIESPVTPLAPNNSPPEALPHPVLPQRRGRGRPRKMGQGLGRRQGRPQLHRMFLHMFMEMSPQCFLVSDPPVVIDEAGNALGPGEMDGNGQGVGGKSGSHHGMDNANGQGSGQDPKTPPGSI